MTAKTTFCCRPLLVCVVLLCSLVAAGTQPTGGGPPSGGGGPGPPQQTTAAGGGGAGGARKDELIRCDAFTGVPAVGQPETLMNVEFRIAVPNTTNMVVMKLSENAASVASDPYDEDDPVVYNQTSRRYNLLIPSEGLFVAVWKQVMLKMTGAIAVYHAYENEYHAKEAVADGYADATLVPIEMSPEYAENGIGFTQPLLRDIGLTWVERSPSLRNQLEEIAVKMVGPTMVTMFCMMFLASIFVGHIMWFVERDINPEMFPKSYLDGIDDACWWAIVTVCTVGYGDKVPISRSGRVVAIFWMFGGMVLVGFFAATITNALSTIAPGTVGSVMLVPKEIRTNRVGYTSLAHLDAMIKLFPELDTVDSGDSGDSAVCEDVRDCLDQLERSEIDGAFLNRAALLLTLAKMENAKNFRVAFNNFINVDYGIFMSMTYGDPDGMRTNCFQRFNLVTMVDAEEFEDVQHDYLSDLGTMVAVQGESHNWVLIGLTMFCVIGYPIVQFAVQGNWLKSTSTMSGVPVYPEPQDDLTNSKASAGGAGGAGGGTVNNGNGQEPHGSIEMDNLNAGDDIVPIPYLQSFSPTSQRHIPMTPGARRLAGFAEPLQRDICELRTQISALTNVVQSLAHNSRAGSRAVTPSNRLTRAINQVEHFSAPSPHHLHAAIPEDGPVTAKDEGAGGQAGDALDLDLATALVHSSPRK